VYPKTDAYLHTVKEYFRHVLGALPIVPDELPPAAQLSPTPFMEFYFDPATSQLVFPI
jgi:hypothetical protein